VLDCVACFPKAPLITISTNHVNATAGTAITPVTISNRGDDAFYYIASNSKDGVWICTGLCGVFSKG
jgi:hypothetical protein